MIVEMKVSDNPALWNLYAEYWRALGNWENAVRPYPNQPLKKRDKPYCLSLRPGQPLPYQRFCRALPFQYQQSGT